jgi:ribosomal protein L9
MYVAVRRYEGVTDPQKVKKLGDEGWVQTLSEMPGFVAHYLVDAGDGVMAAISVFEHKEAEEQSTFRAGEFIQEQAAALLPNLPQVTAGEVVTYQAK